MNAAYYRAAMPDQFTVLGKTLHPFTLGHDILLRRLGSAFCADNSDWYLERQWSVDLLRAALGDLVLAVFVCSRDAETAERELSRPIQLWIKLKLWGFRHRRANIIEEIERFRQYLTEHCSFPEVWRDEESNQIESGSPWTQFLKVALMAHLHQSEREALRCPYGLAIWNYCTFLEHQGHKVIVSDAEQEFIRNAQEIGRQIAEKAKAK